MLALASKAGEAAFAPPPDQVNPVVNPVASHVSLHIL